MSKWRVILRERRTTSGLAVHSTEEWTANEWDSGLVEAVLRGQPWMDGPAMQPAVRQAS